MIHRIHRIHRKNSFLPAFIFLVLLWTLAANIPGYAGAAGSKAGSDEVKAIEAVLGAKKNVKISTVVSSCSIETGKDGEIKVYLVYTGQEEIFKPVIEEEGDALLLREKGYTRAASQEEKWKIKVPLHTSIDFKSAQGSLAVTGVNGDISAATATGRITVKGCRGKLQVKNASGDIKLRDHQGDADIKAFSGDVEAFRVTGDIKLRSMSGDIETGSMDGSMELKVTSGDLDIRESVGDFDAACVSGDLEAAVVEIKGKSSFKVVSGDIYVKLAKTPEFDLVLDSASGNAVLCYNGNPVKGHFQFRARADLGQIISPFAFDKEEEIYEYGKKYLVKSFKKEAAKPLIIIKTATGKAVLEK